MPTANIEQLNYGLALISPVEPLEEVSKPAGFHEGPYGERSTWRIEAISSHVMSQAGLVPILYKAGDVVLLTTPDDEITRTLRERSFLTGGKRVLLITYDTILCRAKQGAK